MPKIRRLVKEALAFLKGDKDEQLILHNANKAEAAIEKQLANLKYEQLDREEAVKTAKEALTAAVLPTDVKINDGGAYTKNIQRAQEGVNTAEKALEDVEYSINYFKGILKNLTETVD